MSIYFMVFSLGLLQNCSLVISANSKEIVNPQYSKELIYNKYLQLIRELFLWLNQLPTCANFQLVTIFPIWFDWWLLPWFRLVHGFEGWTFHDGWGSWKYYSWYVSCPLRKNITHYINAAQMPHNDIVSSRLHWMCCPTYRPAFIILHGPPPPHCHPTSIFLREVDPPHQHNVTFLTLPNNTMCDVAILPINTIHDFVDK